MKKKSQIIILIIIIIIISIFWYISRNIKDEKEIEEEPKLELTITLSNTEFSFEDKIYFKINLSNVGSTSVSVNIPINVRILIQNNSEIIINDLNYHMAGYLQHVIINPNESIEEIINIHPGFVNITIPGTYYVKMYFASGYIKNEIESNSIQFRLHSKK